MILHIQPNPDDYKHAIAAHNSFAAAGGLRQTRATLIWMAVFLPFLLFAVLPNLFPIREWALAPGAVLTLTLVYPAMILATALQVYLRTRSPIVVAPTGLVQIGSSHQGRAVHPAKFSGLMGWIVFAVLTAGLCTMMWIRPPKALPVITPSKAVPAPQVEIETTTNALRLPGGVLFAGSLLASVGAFQILGKVQRAYQTKVMLEGQPSLLLPRTWDFDEDKLTESGEQLVSIMKWAYLSRFLETPRVIMLYPGENSFYLVPKAAFESELQLAEFMGLLMRKVPNGVMQPRAFRGFSVPVRAIPVEIGMPNE
jgi:hypothetical protein